MRLALMQLQAELEGEDATVVRRKSRKRAWEEDEEEAGAPRVEGGSWGPAAQCTPWWAGSLAAQAARALPAPTTVCDPVCPSRHRVGS